MLVKNSFNLLRLAGLPQALRVIIYALIGIIAGSVVVLVRISNAASYLSDSPNSCINCHVMTDAYASWQRGSHGRVAVCNDCHVPHTNIVAKYGFKAMDGTKHSAIFTLRREPQVLESSHTAQPVIQQNCLRCHQSQFEMIRLSKTSEQKCWDCHQNIHGPVRSLSASPSELRPTLPNSGLFEIKGDQTDEQRE